MPQALISCLLLLLQSCVCVWGHMSMQSVVQRRQCEIISVGAACTASNLCRQIAEIQLWRKYVTQGHHQ